MHSTRLSSVLTFLALTAVVSPHPAGPLHPREVDSLPDPPVAGIVATVTSSNGTDITSNFQTLLYNGAAVVDSSSLRERQIPTVVRKMNFCRRPSADFEYSECDYRASFTHSLQRYRVRCSIPSTRQGEISTLAVFEQVSLASFPKVYLF